MEEERNGKLICDKIYSFDDARRELWIQFPDKETFEKQENETLALLSAIQMDRIRSLFTLQKSVQ